MSTHNCTCVGDEKKSPEKGQTFISLHVPKWQFLSYIDGIFCTYTQIQFYYPCTMEV